MNFLGKSCPVCSKTIEQDDDVVVCPKCGAPYHRECYTEKGKCIFTDLHKNKQSWKEVYDKSEKNADDAAPEEEAVSCPVCGIKNPASAIVCKRCGSFLRKPVARIFYDEADDTDQTDFDPQDPDSFNPFGDGNPFSVFFDPMAGVKKDEDFDGVTGAEIAKYVGSNTPYYMQVFQKIKYTGSSRVNFAAFFFTASWYMYRKQYVKGSVIGLIYLIISVVNMLIYRSSTELWSAATSALKESGLQYITYRDYLDYVLQSCTFQEGTVMLLPYIFSAGMFIMMVICAVTANKGYYRHTIKQIKKIKSSVKEDEVLKEIETKAL